MLQKYLTERKLFALMFKKMKLQAIKLKVTLLKEK